MDVPDLVRERLGDETVHATVGLGDDDTLLVTPTRTILYRGDGLLSDERVAEFPHDAERLTLTESRRKAKFQFEYVAGTESFTVLRDRADRVLEFVMGGLLRVANVAEPDERVAGVYRFSELTLVITDRRVVKHIGAAVWDDDYEVYPFEDVTGLSFEEGSVATQLVLGIDGRPQRIKAPNDEAPLVRQTLQEVLFEFHGVDSIEELNDRLRPAEGEPDLEDDAVGYGLDADIDPLVGGAGETDDEESDSLESAGGRRPRSMDVDPTASRGESNADAAAGGSTPGSSAPSPGDAAANQRGADGGAGRDHPDSTTGDTPAGTDDAIGEQPAAGNQGISPDQLRTLEKELAELRAAVQEQNELLRDQQAAIDGLRTELESD